MRKLSEIRGEDALDVLADIIEPVSKIFEDETFVAYAKAGKRFMLTQNVLRHHKQEILTVLAILNDVPPEEYNPSLIEIPMLVIELFNDPDLLQLFQSAAPSAFSGSATESTTETVAG